MVVIMKVAPFIIGSPRSGTTLLRFMLDAHPLLAIPPETGFLPMRVPIWLSSHFQQKLFYYSLCQTHSAWNDFGLSRADLWQALNTLRPFSISDGLRTFYRLYADKFAKPYWGDKTPRYALHLDEIRRLLPEARFIHLIRDGRDAMISLRQQWFSPGDSINIQAKFWVKHVNTARKDGLNHLDYLEIRYENLILEPQIQIQRICNFLNLPFNPSMLDYQDHARQRLQEHQGRTNIFGLEWLSPTKRRQQQIRTTQALDLKLIEQWRTVLNAQEQQQFWKIAGDLLTELGYSK
jgi:hypothetical protein